MLQSGQVKDLGLVTALAMLRIDLFLSSAASPAKTNFINAWFDV
jgi:hypothetical protein